MIGWYMTHSYEGYGWIKVKNFKFDPEKSWEENYKAFKKHHIEETTFLIEEVQYLNKLLRKLKKDNMEDNGFHEIGEFSVKSSMLVLSDPCYDRDTGCKGSLESVLNGTWIGSVFTSFINGWGKRVVDLYAHHSDYSLGRMTFKEKVGFKIPVDSGQVGVFCDTEFQGRDDTEDHEEWYKNCCDLTLDSLHGAGLLPSGIVSSSGFGDGVYDAFIERNEKDQIVGVKVVFVTAEDFEE